VAQGKVHKAAMIEERGPGALADGPLERGAMCRQRHRKLLPLLLADEWDAVTCERCLTHRPSPARGAIVTWLRGLMKRFRGGR